MPWCKRAFSLRQMHSSSQIYLGILDYNTAGQNDRVGRVVIDLSAYVANTEYLLHFNIYNTESMAKRRPRGTITIRLFMELENQRKLVMSALSFPRGHAYFVNVQQRKDFFDVRYTCTGKYGAEEYGIKQIEHYLDEVYMCRRILFYAYHLCTRIIFWRGHAPLTLCLPRLCPCKDIEELGGRRCTRSVTILLPVRSAVVFLAAVHLVENPDDIPSFIFGAIAFVMLSALHFRRSSPNKLERGQPYYYYLCLVLFGKGFIPPHDVEPYENAEEYKARKDRIEEKAAHFEKEAEEARLENLKRQEEYQKEMEEIGLANNLDISTQGVGGGLSIGFSPLKGLYIQIQNSLELVVGIIRLTRNVLVWEEAFLAFWLTSAAIVLSFVCIFIPWGKGKLRYLSKCFCLICDYLIPHLTKYVYLLILLSLILTVIEWTCRFFVWTFLGPWMKVVDIFWHSHFKQWLQKLQRYQAKQQREALDLAKMEARNTKEDVEKLKEMKTAIFGRYISKVPLYHCGRYKDGENVSLHACYCVPLQILCTLSPLLTHVCVAPTVKAVPLLSSEAHPFQPSDLEKEKAKWNFLRVHGQKLTGTMIPVVSISD